MFDVSCLLIIFTIFYPINSAFSGSHLFWGPQSLRNFENHVFSTPNEEKFKTIVEDVKVFLIFCSSDFTKLDENVLPRLNEIINKREYFYLSETKSIVDILNGQNKTKIIDVDPQDPNLDFIITEEYLKFEKKYGTENVLSLLTWPGTTTTSIKNRVKRNDIQDQTEAPPIEEEDEVIYNVVGKSLLYTKSAPVLRMIISNDDLENYGTTDESKELREVVYILKNHDLVTLDDRDQLSRLIITFRLGDGYKVILRFRFPMTMLSWSLTSVELEDSKGLYLVLPVVSGIPTAPIGFSYKCSSPLVFKNGTTTLSLFNVQAQPALKGRNRFGDAYNCVGFTTIPIWSGILVSSLLLGGLTIAILVIMDIRTPNKFENSKTKLTITNYD